MIYNIMLCIIIMQKKKRKLVEVLVSNNKINVKSCIFYKNNLAIEKNFKMAFV